MADLSTDIEGGEMILILGGLLLAGYFIYKLLKSPGGQSLSSAVQSAGNVIVNATTGQLSCAQVEAAAEAEAQQIVKASGGSITYDQAIVQARADQQALHKAQMCCYAAVCTFPSCIPVLGGT